MDRWYDRSSGDEWCWAIEVDAYCIGTAQIRTLETHDRRATCAFGIFAPRAWDQGYGTEARRLALRHAFETLKLHRVYMRLLASHHRAVAYYEKCGFVCEGALIAGQWHSDVMMSILDQEYGRS